MSIDCETRFILTGKQNNRRGKLENDVRMVQTYDPQPNPHQLLILVTVVNTAQASKQETLLAFVKNKETLLCQSKICANT